MTQEEIDVLMAKVKTETRAAVQLELDAYKAANKPIDKATIEALIIEKAPKNDVDMDAMKSTIDTLKADAIKTANELKALKENPAKQHTDNSFKGLFFKAFNELEGENKDLFEKAKKGERMNDKKINLEIKAVNITDATTIGAGATQISLTDNTGIISPILQRAEKYLSGASVGSISGNVAMWIEETTESGTPIFIAEAATKTQVSVLYVEKTQTVRKIGIYAKVSSEFLADLPQLYSYVTTNMAKRLGIVKENNLLLGTGSGVTLFGLNSYKTAFTAGTAANLIPFANYIDVIQAANKQVVLAFGIPNRWYIHPDDMFILKSAKSSQGVPLWKDYMNTTGDVVIGGALLVETPAMTAGSFLGGDTTVAHVMNREGLSIQLGESGDDFINNLKTILIEERLCQFVSANETQLIVGGTWAAAVAALTTP